MQQFSTVPPFTAPSLRSSRRIQRWNKKARDNWKQCM